MSHRPVLGLLLVLGVLFIAPDACSQQEVTRLIEELESDDVAERRAALRELGKMGRKAGSALEAVVTEVRRRRSPLRGEALECLTAICRSITEALASSPRGAPPDRELWGYLDAINGPVLDIGTRLLAVKDDDTCVQALHLLAALGERAKKASPAITGLLESGSPTVRQWAAWAVGRTGVTEEAVTPAFAKAIEQGTSGDRQNLLWALREAGEAVEPAAHAVILTLGDPSGAVRRNATTAIGQLGTRAMDVVPTLIELIDHEDTNRAEGALLSIWAIGREALRHIGAGALMGTPEEEIRQRKAPWRRLVKELADAAAPRLIRCMEEDQGQRRRYAIGALGTFGHSARDAAPWLIANLRKLSDVELETATWSLGNIGSSDPAAVDAFVSVLQRGSAGARRWAAWGLRQMGDKAKKAGPAILAAVEKEPDPQTKGELHRALEAVDPAMAGGKQMLLRRLASGELASRFEALQKLLEKQSLDDEEKAAIGAFLESEAEGIRDWWLERVLPKLPKSPAVARGVAAMMRAAQERRAFDGLLDTARRVGVETPVLVEILEDKLYTTKERYFAEGCVDKLIELSPAAGGRVVVEKVLTTHPLFEVRRHAAQRAGALGDHVAELIPSLLRCWSEAGELLEQPQNAEAREGGFDRPFLASAFLTAIGHAGAKAKRHVGTMLDLASKSEGRDRVYFIEPLCRIAPDDKRVHELVLANIDGKDQSLREYGVTALNLLKDHVDVEKVYARLLRTRHEPLYLVIRELQAIGARSPEIRKELLVVAREAEGWLAESALRHLVSIGVDADGVRPLIVARLGSEDPSVAESALAQLREYGPGKKDEAALTRALGQAERQKRLEAAWALGHEKLAATSRPVTALVKLVEGNDAALTWLALRALRRRSGSAMAAVQPILKRLEVLAPRSIERSRDPKEQMKSRWCWNQVSEAVSLLGDIGAPASVAAPTLERLFPADRRPGIVSRTLAWLRVPARVRLRVKVDKALRVDAVRWEDGDPQPASVPLRLPGGRFRVLVRDGGVGSGEWVELHFSWDGKLATAEARLAWFDADAAEKTGYREVTGGSVIVNRSDWKTLDGVMGRFEIESAKRTVRGAFVLEAPFPAAKGGDR